MADQNKIKYGLCNVYWAPLTITEGVPSFGTPVAFPGAVSISLPPAGENEPFYADNIEYYTVPGAVGYNGELEMAYVKDDFAAYAYGEITDDDGVVYEEAVPTLGAFALTFQFEGDANAVRHVLYNVTASKPEVNSSTRGETIEPQTSTIPIRANSLFNALKNKYLVKARVANTEDTAAVYSGWNSAIKWPVGT